MKKIINVETRRVSKENSGHVGFKNWQPKFIIWPTFDGMTKSSYIIDCEDEFPDEINEEWGLILSRTIEKISMQHNLISVCENQHPDKIIEITDSLIGVFKRILKKVRIYNKHGIEQFALTANYFNICTTRCYNNMHYLINSSNYRKNTSNLQENSTCASMIFKLGTEEPVLEICCFEFEKEFIDALKSEAIEQNYEMQFSQIPFVSAWELR